VPDEGKFVEFLSLKGLIFQHTDWKEYNISVQSAYGVPGTIYMEGARNCSIEDCTIEQIGNFGIELQAGCMSNRIIGNTIHDVGAGAIKVNGSNPSEPKSGLTGYTVITDNHIYDCGTVHTSGVGVLLQNTFGTTCSHNHIHVLYSTAISVGWSWTYGPTVCRDNHIEKNHIHDLGKGVLSDMGGVYTLGLQPGTKICGNLIHDIVKSCYGGWAIYPDQGSSHLVIENNISYNTSSSPFHQHFGRENIIRNNIWAFGDEAIIALSRGNDCHYGGDANSAFTFERNIVVTDNQPAFVGALADKTGNLENGDFTSDLNVFWDVNGGEIVSGNGVHNKSGIENLSKAFDWEAWQKIGFDRHSVVADPMFRDIEKRDFRLAKNSPAWAMGFKPIDMSDVGPRPKNKRTHSRTT